MSRQSAKDKGDNEMIRRLYTDLLTFTLQLTKTRQGDRGRINTYLNSSLILEEGEEEEKEEEEEEEEKEEEFVSLSIYLDIFREVERK